MNTEKRDHGGGLDAAAATFGTARADWLDLSTGINPVPYPIPPITTDAWTALPDQAARHALEDAARAFWSIPDQAAILAVPGASAAIAQIPRLANVGTVCIPGPTYNEHAASFTAAGWTVMQTANATDASVHVNPNNPDGCLWHPSNLQGAMRIIDESFCDVTPDATMMSQAVEPGTLILKSFGKFWGLAGLRLGFVIGDHAMIECLRAMIGPWAVSGPALTIGTAALNDHEWALATRARLQQDSTRLDQLVLSKGATFVGGTSLFRLYDVQDALGWQNNLARHHIWSRIFPYSHNWLRLGLPDPSSWTRLERALV